jgi:hypothetical protein
VVATVIEPLREEWCNVQSAAETKFPAADLGVLPPKSRCS